MNLMKRLLPLAALIMAISVADVQAQHVPSRERVDPTLRRRTEIDGNNLRTSVFNFCFSGRTGAGQGVPYEWPKNTGRHYVALVALFVGGEVVDDTGRTVRIVDLPAFRTNQATGGDWNMNPVAGYFNVATGKLAKSDEPATWPAFWPDKMSDPQDPGWSGKWNGFFGKDQFNADQEIYARIGDDNYNRYRYTPDTTDLTRRGLGLIIDYRALQWSQASVADGVFFIHEIKNDGTKDLKKTGVTLWLADFVGGDGDSQDDTPGFDLILDVAFSLDADGISSNPAFANACVGAAATLYLETPGNAVDRIDNDGDSPEYGDGPRVLPSLFEARIPGTTVEISGDQIDNNHNGLIDEDSTYIPFGQQRGVGFADGIDNNDNGELLSPVVTQTMINQAATDAWGRWPPNPENDLAFWPGNDVNFRQESIHLIQVGPEDLGKRFKDNIDNDGNSYGDLPVVTQQMIDIAATDPYKRYRVPGTNVILYDLGPEDLGKKYINRDGLRDAGVDELIDEMIDESRNDGIDNDGDWNPFTDDVGLDGAPNTGDFGEGDGIPTSGVGTPFPGEPNIDKTDVSEADQIGLTNVQYLAAGAINFSQTADIFFWAEFMIPGSFVNPELIGTGEYDLFVSSGLFPLNAGQIERISFAVVMGNAVRCPGNADFTGAKADALRKRTFAQLAYNEDYQFAQAPLEPTVTAVATTNERGRPQVTLYWDEVAESSVDRFLAGIPGVNGQDFEGYRIYRATDPAFQDAQKITDAYGNPAPWLKPIAQFDLDNGIRGDSAAVPFNGVAFYMGDDTGIQHTWTDTTVQAGQLYYYAVRAYDQGYRPLNISPAESNLRLSIDPITGKVKDFGKSIAIITAEAPVAGYMPPNVSAIIPVAGTATGSIGYRIVDPSRVRDNATYRITFEDTVHIGRSGDPDTLRTKFYTLANATNTSLLDTLIASRRPTPTGLDLPVVDGVQLVLNNDRRFGMDTSRSRYSRNNMWKVEMQGWREGFVIGKQYPNDYKIIFGPVGIDTSTTYDLDGQGFIVPAAPVNFTVRNPTTNAKVKFAFFEKDPAGGPGIYSGQLDPFFRDNLIILEPDAANNLLISWAIVPDYDTVHTLYTTGDTISLVTFKSFGRNDVFEYTTRAQRVDKQLAANSLDKIKVVPNPYVAAANWEPRNPFPTGRGPRSIHFTHLPQQCTIRIYNISGELVATIDHDSPLLNGTAEWNLLSRDQLQVSYGVYIYHVEAPGVGQKVGKFAVIK
ncbi:MAG: hypothetical protein KF749_14980 [Bacteroidetes bacterium]|nr:hypothetical protein [Bacteroidota bacterium]MCW5896023.1 hypothetical protein [Bacteroidota bacterium]